MPRQTALLISITVFAGLATSTQAQIYLSGVVSYGANAGGGSVTEPAEFDNLLGTAPTAEITINGQPRGTTYLLSDGPNAFTFSGVWSNFNALSLYFSPTGAAFSRPSGSMPDLVTYGSTAPLTPAAGTLVQNNGPFSGLIAYSGATSFTLGDRSVSVTAFSFSPASGSGTFELTVVPAPGAAALLGLGSLLAARRRR